MGHVGLTPQSATMLGGFKAQGRTADPRSRSSRRRATWRTRVAARSSSRQCRRRSRAQHGGAFVPTIGIGAGADSDGQVLVYHDLLGLSEGHLPRFVKRTRTSARSATRSGLRHGGPQRRVPRGAAHIRDARGGASRVRGPPVSRGGDPISAGSAAARPTVARLRPQLQPWTVRTPMTSRIAPSKRELGAAESPVARPPVVAAGAEEVFAVDRDPERPHVKSASASGTRESATTCARGGTCRACRDAGRAVEQAAAGQYTANA